MPEKKILTRRETANYLGIGLTTLDKLISRKHNPLPHIRAGSRVLIPTDALDEWIKAEMNSTTTNKER